LPREDSILSQGWQNGNFKKRSLLKVNEHFSNLPFCRDWPKLDSHAAII